MSGKNSVLISILKYASYFAVYYLIRTPVHEWIHLYVGSFFGGEGYIIPALWGATTVFTRSPSNTAVTYFSGGLGVGGVYMLLIYWRWRERNFEECAALFPHSFSEFSYGLFEGLYLPSGGLIGDLYTLNEYVGVSVMVAVAGWTVGLLVGWYVWFSNMEFLKETGSIKDVRILFSLLGCVAMLGIALSFLLSSFNLSEEKPILAIILLISQF